MYQKRIGGFVRRSALLAAVSCATAAARGDVFTNVPNSEVGGYQLVYDLDIPTRAQWNNSTVPYTIDNHKDVTVPWNRVAYYMELKDASNNTTWAYASFDSFGGGIRKIGIPNLPVGAANGPIFQKNVSNMNVFSNSPNVTTGTGLGGGNIEFWPNNYSQPNGASVPNASATTYDFGDTVTTATPNGHGSFQIHNHAVTATTGQTIMAYNKWGTGASTNGDIGIGNAASGSPDYTLSANAANYTVKRLQVLVKPSSEQFTDPTTVTAQSAGYKLIYGLQVPRSGPTNNAVGVPYQVDRPEAVTQPISRIGYFMELHRKTDPAGQNQYVWVSMDAFTQDPKKIGVPNTESGAFFQQNVTNLSVDSNVTGVITGTSLGDGNIEFWPSNYAAAKAAASPANASNSTLDFGDSNASTSAGYGSMQIHNPGAAQTVLAFNNWGNGSTDYDIGIGNNTTAASNGQTNPDWTFRSNSFNDYDVRNLQVYVLEVPEPSSIALVGAAGMLLLRRRRSFRA